MRWFVALLTTVWCLCLHSACALETIQESGVGGGADAGRKVQHVAEENVSTRPNGARISPHGGTSRRCD
jgi:hypothetical protein